MSAHTVSPQRQAKRLGVFAIYAPTLIIILGLYSLPHLFPNMIGTAYIGLYLALTAISLAVWRLEPLPPRHVLSLGILCLIALLPLSMLTSNDAQRYLWDGAVFLSGLDPYLTAPNAPEAAELRRIWPTPPEHAAYPTLYPPGALTLFGICALAGPIYGIWVWKALVTAAAILSLCFVYGILERRNALKALPLAALSPFLLFETGAGYHLDVFCVLGVSAALFSLERERIIWAAIFIGLAASVKFIPAIIAGPLLFYLKPPKAAKLFLTASLTWAAVYICIFVFGYKPLGLLPTFFEKWRGGAPLYPLLESLQTSTGLSQKQFLVLLSSMAISGFGLSAYMARRGHIIAAIMVSLATPLLLSPILFPWYLMVFIPLIAIRPNASLILAVTLTPLSYVVLNKWLSDGVWSPVSWPNYILLAAIIVGPIIDYRIRGRFELNVLNSENN